MATMEGKWSSGLCNFPDECLFCLYAFCCPCCALGTLSGKMSKGRTLTSGEAVLTSAGYCGIGCLAGTCTGTVCTFCLPEVVCSQLVRAADTGCSK
ncbi:hypothetical protein T484DRAFT_1831218 [Baffinella frigidus]|nr:hypothetical protein T484DRAFT_1831218 [Cryptophyta sp. CCMP2293]